MLELDGADAGGQFLRSALTLAALDGRAVRIENVRGDRSMPGVRPQHLAVVETMASICDATVSGAETGSETVQFDPDPSEEDDAPSATIPGGHYAVDIGTAGSTTLLFDAISPLATRLEEPLTVTATGGTDVKWSPPLDYLRRVKLPLLRRAGLQAVVEVDRRGFYPAGGGRATLRLAPSTMTPLDLVDRGPLQAVRLYSTESASLADRDVADRQIEGFLDRLGPVELGGDDARPGSDDQRGALAERVVTTAASDSPGSAVVARLDYENAICGASALGERGTPAERVGANAAEAAERSLDHASPVDAHLGDQLVVWLAVAGGRVSIPSRTDHVETSLSLVSDVGYEVTAKPAPATDAAGTVLESSLPDA
ncbi:RNA 3'-terminal phosphate cyclase [Halovivax limisalsi]|uniref:RNA 3'-terminal phosphate cyclase n=1 Tax=Halovivax limisalsi TaxID=1453760 RepID=UPI001FFD7C52|nr:RNA 3'-terminal phosphate cyclase [Halovivax limisalsi]